MHTKPSSSLSSLMTTPSGSAPEKEGQRRRGGIILGEEEEPPLAAAGRRRRRRRQRLLTTVTSTPAALSSRPQVPSPAPALRVPTSLAPSYKPQLTAPPNQFYNFTSSEDRLRRSLTTLYVVVAFAVFVAMPSFLIARWRNKRRRLQEQQEQQEQRGDNDGGELATAAVRRGGRSAIILDESNREARRKLREQRRAWITVLLSHVQMELTADNFVNGGGNGTTTTADHPAAAKCRRTASCCCSVVVADAASSNGVMNDDEGKGEGHGTDYATAVAAHDVVVDCPHQGDDEEEETMIRVPAPGMRQYDRTSTTSNWKGSSSSWRTVPGTCAICLGHYQLGEIVAWSSNVECDHCFHLQCIESWLHKQRNLHTLGALCPICRRDFLVDPCDEESSTASSTTVSSTFVVAATEVDASASASAELPPAPTRTDP